MMGKRRKNRSLFSHVFWRVIPIAGLIMAIFGYFAYMSLHRADMDEVEKWLEQQSRHARDLIEMPVATLVIEAQALAEHELVISGFVDIGNRDTYLKPFFRTVRVHGPPGVEVTLVDHRGRLIVSNREDPAIGYHWIEAIKNRKPEVGLDETGLTVAAPIEISFRPEGAVLLRYPPATLPKLFGLQNYPLSTALIDEEGTVLFSTDERLAVAGQPLGDVDPASWMTSRQPLPSIPGITMTAARMTDEALEGVYEVRDILIITLVGSLLMIVASTGVTALLAGRETRLLGQRMRGIEGARDMHRRIDASGPRELQTLGETFNAMLETLEKETTSRDYFDSIINSLSEILIVSSLDGEIRTVNPAARRFLKKIGTPSENAFVNVMFAAESYGSHCNPPEFVDWRSDIITLEATYALPDRDRMTIQWLRSIQLDQRGAAMGIIFIGQDITERARIEKLKNEFISTVNHELRTPLTAISGTLGLLKGGVAGKIPKKAQDLIAIGLSNSDRLIHLINDLLDIQKIEADGMEFRLQPVDLVKIAEESIRHNASLGVPRGVTLTLDNRIGDIPLTGDPDRLAQVMTNLLSNAVKYSPDGGVVTVTLAGGDGGPVVSVADQGPGIPEEFRDRIFGRFAQADSSDSRKKGGTGLGLAIAQAIVRRHDGQIWYQSKVGKGTTFYFWLPSDEPLET